MKTIESMAYLLIVSVLIVSAVVAWFGIGSGLIDPARLF